MKQIPLTRGKVALVSDDWYNYLINTKWQVSGKYAMGTVGGKMVYMHRIIMNPPDGKQVDHINGDGLDNRVENLRIATSSENNYNTGKQSNNTSGYKGVSWHKTRKTWQVLIGVGGRLIRIPGVFNSAEDAARAYDEAAKKYHGVFARLNFP